MAAGEPRNDPTIADSDRCYRRIPPSQYPYNDNLKRRWPSSASLRPESDDNEVSVYLGSKIDELGLDELDVLEGHPRHGLMRFPVGVARGVGLSIVGDPIVGSERPLRVDPAHAVLTGTPTPLTSRRSRKPARAILSDAQLVILREPEPDDPDEPEGD